MNWVSSWVYMLIITVTNNSRHLVLIHNHAYQKIKYPVITCNHSSQFVWKSLETTASKIIVFFGSFVKPSGSLKFWKTQKWQFLQFEFREQGHYQSWMVHYFYKEPPVRVLRSNLESHSSKTKFQFWVWFQFWKSDLVSGNPNQNQWFTAGWLLISSQF